MTPEEALKRVKCTVGWYNNNGGLQQPIIYKSVKDQLESIHPREALKILKGLEEKGPLIRNPTAWVRAAAEKCGPEPDAKIGKTIKWYNENGGLPSPIRYDDVKTVLGYLPVREALTILKSMESKTATIRDPTAWVYRAAENRLARGPSQGQDWSSAGPDWSEPSQDWPAPSQDWSAASENVFIPSAAGQNLFTPNIIEGLPIYDMSTTVGGAGYGTDMLAGGAGFGTGMESGMMAGGADFGADMMAGGSGFGTDMMAGGAGFETGMESGTIAGGAASEAKVKKTIAWYNKHGGLQQPISYDEVAVYFAAMDGKDVLKILKGLDGQGLAIANPTDFLINAAQRHLGFLP